MILYIDNNEQYSDILLPQLEIILRQIHKGRDFKKGDPKVFSIACTNFQEVLDQYQRIILSNELMLIMINMELKYISNGKRCFFNGIKVMKEIMFNPVLNNFVGPIVLLSFVCPSKRSSIFAISPQIQNLNLGVPFSQIPTVRINQYPLGSEDLKKLILFSIVDRCPSISEKEYTRLRGIYYLKELLDQFDDHHAGVCCNNNLVQLNLGNLSQEVYSKIVKINLALSDIFLQNFLANHISRFISLEFLNQLREVLSTSPSISSPNFDCEKVYQCLVKLFHVFSHITHAQELNPIRFAHQEDHPNVRSSL